MKKHFARIVFVGLAIAISSLFQQQSAQARPLKMVTSTWPPYYAENLPEKGFFSALVLAAFAAVDRQESIGFVPWQRAMIMVEKTDADILLGVRKTPERAQKFLFSDVVYYDELVLIAGQTVPFDRFDGLRDLEGYVIGVGRGFAYSAAFDKAEFLTKEEATNFDENIRKLLLGRLDMIAGSKAPNLYELKRLAGAEYQKYRVLEPRLNRAGLHLAVSRELENGEELIADFNRALKQILADGVFQSILQEFEQISERAPEIKSGIEATENSKV